MSSSPLVRVVMALYLALWSPVMCCCGIKATLARFSGGEAVQCEPRTCCALADSPTANEPDQGCCEVRESPSACCGAASAQTDPDQPAPANDGKCRCHDKPNDRLDTGGKITAPVLTLQAAFDFTCSDEPRLHQVSSPFSHPGGQFQQSHAPPNSLLAQRCLLLI